MGTYNPLPNKDNIKEIAVNVERVHYWLANGAQPSDRVAWLFGKLGVLPPAPKRDFGKTAIPKEIRRAEAAAAKK